MSENLRRVGGCSYLQLGQRAKLVTYLLPIQKQEALYGLVRFPKKTIMGDSIVLYLWWFLSQTYAHHTLHRSRSRLTMQMPNISVVSCALPLLLLFSKLRFSFYNAPKIAEKIQENSDRGRGRFFNYMESLISDSLSLCSSTDNSQRSQFPLPTQPGEVVLWRS